MGEDLGSTSNGSLTVLTGQRQVLQLPSSPSCSFQVWYDGLRCGNKEGC
jgi:hypothetical protein